jgi:ABC-type molybdate transport system substrate-binding protein
MKKLSLRVLCTLVMLCVAPICAAAEDATTAAALHILHRMSLQEKIGQKLMLDFRYWCPTPSPRL